MTMAGATEGLGRPSGERLSEAIWVRVEVVPRGAGLEGKVETEKGVRCGLGS